MHSPPVPRGRHAPPLEVRLERQRARLFAAAARAFARVGYAEASAEGIAREAGMSKATFYEHFANKEECILALFDTAAQTVLRAVRAAADEAGEDVHARTRAGLGAFLAALEAYPDEARTLLVEIIGAGPRAAERRGAILQAFADLMADRFPSPHDGYAVVGAAVELAARQLRTGVPADVRELEPVLWRLTQGLLR